MPGASNPHTQSESLTDIQSDYQLNALSNIDLSGLLDGPRNPEIIETNQLPVVIYDTIIWKIEQRYRFMFAEYGFPYYKAIFESDKCNFYDTEEIVKEIYYTNEMTEVTEVTEATEATERKFVETISGRIYEIKEIPIQEITFS